MTELRAIDRAASGPAYDYDELVFEDRVHRLLYTDPRIFDEEMTKIFGAVWVYLGHESQIPEPNDFVTARLGRRPIILVRDSGGVLRALYNRCTHRGSTVCREARGSAKSFQCGYHGWTFLNSGKLNGVPWPDGYADNFDDEKFNLAQVPRVESYRGFVFGTLNLDAPPLAEYLGGVAGPLDEWLDRHPGGKVVLCEANRLKFKGNWKLLYDNSADGYHVGVLAPLAAGDGEPARRGRRQGDGVLPHQPRQRADVCPLFRQRAPFQGQAPQCRGPARRAVGDRGTASRDGAFRGLAPPAPRRQGRPRARSRLVRAGEHQRLPQPPHPRQPYPGIDPGRRRRDRHHLVRHRRGRR